MEKVSENEVPAEPTPVGAPTRRIQKSRAMLVLIPTAILVIGGSVLWKMNGPAENAARQNAPRDLRASPSFQLSDQNSQMVRLESYLHRHNVLLVFFEPKKGPAGDPWLRILNMNHESVTSGGFVVFGISTALPQQNRTAKFELPLLSEVNPDRPVHKQWGAIDAAGDSLPRMFYINRARQVQFDGQTPKPVDNPGALVKAILEGRDPESVL